MKNEEITQSLLELGKDIEEAIAIIDRQDKMYLDYFSHIEEKHNKLTNLVFTLVEVVDNMNERMYNVVSKLEDKISGDY